MSNREQLIKKLTANFSLRWDNWRALLQALVEGPSGKLICPTSRELEFLPQQQSIQIKLPYSICLYGIPLKLNNRNSEKIAIFIDGDYELEQNKEENLRRIKSSIAFYKVAAGRKANTLSLLDAYHFDFWDSPPNGHAPHPVFHVQRNIRCNEAEPRYNVALQSTPGFNQVTLKTTTDSDKDKLFRLGTLRIPTPQMDIFNLGAIVAADQLVGNDSENRWLQFQKLLEIIHGETGNTHHVKVPDKHIAKIYESPRKNVADWYLARA